MTGLPGNGRTQARPDCLIHHGREGPNWNSYQSLSACAPYFPPRPMTRLAPRQWLALILILDGHVCSARYLHR